MIRYWEQMGRNLTSQINQGILEFLIEIRSTTLMTRTHCLTSQRLQRIDVLYNLVQTSLAWTRAALSGRAKLGYSRLLWAM